MRGAGNNRLPVLAAEIAQAHAACRRSTVETIQHAVEAGHRLIEAKRLVQHGQWLPWLRANLPAIGTRTAQRYTAAAERAGESDTVSFFRLRDLVRPIRERFGVLDRRRVLILTPSTDPGFTHVTVVSKVRWEAGGFLRPLRDDAVETAVSAFFGSAMPVTWVSRRSIPRKVNPWLVGAERLGQPDQFKIVEEIVAAADERLEALGYTGPRAILPEGRA